LLDVLKQIKALAVWKLLIEGDEIDPLGIQDVYRCTA
jgi:hypothetical protein